MGPSTAFVGQKGGPLLPQVLLDLCPAVLHLWFGHTLQLKEKLGGHFAGGGRETFSGLKTTPSALCHVSIYFSGFNSFSMDWFEV